MKITPGGLKCIYETFLKNKKVYSCEQGFNEKSLKISKELLLLLILFLIYRLNPCAFPLAVCVCKYPYFKCYDFIGITTFSMFFIFRVIFLIILTTKWPKRKNNPHLMRTHILTRLLAVGCSGQIMIFIKSS